MSAPEPIHSPQAKDRIEPYVWKVAGVVILHIWALHIPGSGNPTGVDVKDERDTLPFHPFYTAKDGWFAAFVLLLYAVVTYFAPDYLGHPDNYIPANPGQTLAVIEAVTGQLFLVVAVGKIISGMPRRGTRSRSSSKGICGFGC